MTKAVLFDLDGTLIDTGPDFANIVNRMRKEKNMPEIEYSDFRPKIAIGSAAMTQFSFNMTTDSPEYEATLARFYKEYMATMGEHASLFDGIKMLLDELDQQEILWGVVTNRQLDFIPKILKHFSLYDRAACIVGSDSTAHRKPHPEPLLHAAKLIDKTPEQCFYVGDFATDIEAGNAAHMTTIAVTWGYHDGIPSLQKEHPDHVVDNPAQLLELVTKKRPIQ
jgi:N-acetyl-D-muramate 6-phosphate phosphatase